MATSEQDEEIEEGELPEDGELEENEENVAKEKEEKAKHNKTLKGASESTQKPVTTNSHTETSGGSREGGVQEFIKKKRAELAEKVKNQLLAGVKKRLGSETISDDGNEKQQPKQSVTASADASPTGGGKSGQRDAVQSLNAPSATMTVQSFPKKESPHRGPKYRDLDKVQDTTETMLSSWLKRPKGSSSSLPRKKSLLDSPPIHSSFDDIHGQHDPNEEYYGTVSSIASPPPVDSSLIDGAQDQDYRMTSSGDQDYRIPPPQDVDYRRDQMRRPSDEDSIGDFDEKKPGPFLAGGLGGAGAVDGNEFGDIDERLPPAGNLNRHHDRRPKRSFSDESASESPDDEHGTGRGRGKRRRRSPTSSTGRRRGGASGRWAGDRPPCKFFREGYCREGDSCTFGHDVEPSWKPPEKRPELCRFYMNGYCRNGRRCPYLHGDYPCKDFHKGDCSKGEECRFSHEPLNDVTRPLYEQMLKDEDLAAKVSVPNAKSTRKVLLGAPPPPMSMKPPLHHEPPRMSPPMLQPPMDQFRQRYRSPSPPSSYFHPPSQADQFGHNHGPPFVNNTLGPGHMVPTAYGPGGAGPGHPLPVSDPYHSQFTPSQANMLPMDPGGCPGGDSVSMHMTTMLRQIKAGMKGDDIEESPASPEPSNEPQDTSDFRPRTIAHVVYRLIPVAVPPAKQSAAIAKLLQASLTDSKLRDDPRIKKLLTTQFNAGSDEILHQITAKDTNQQQALPSRDPRSKAARDPRLSRLQQQTAPAATSSDRYGFQQQIPSTRPDQSALGYDSGSGFPAAVEGNIAGSLAPPAQMLPTMPNMGFNVPGNALVPAGGWMPQMNLIASSGAAAALGNVNVPYYDAVQQQQFVQSIPPNLSSNGPGSSPPQPRHHYSGPMMADSPPLPGGKSIGRNSYQSRLRPSTSPIQHMEDQDMRNQAVMNFGNGGSYDIDERDDSQEGRDAQHESMLSLRERRKDLQYESPLG